MRDTPGESVKVKEFNRETAAHVKGVTLRYILYSDLRPRSKC